MRSSQSTLKKKRTSKVRIDIAPLAQGSEPCEIADKQRSLNIAYAGWRQAHLSVCLFYLGKEGVSSIYKFKKTP